MKLIRGWEEQYSPAASGGIRLSQAAVYQNTDEADGIGDYREGEVRVVVDASATVSRDRDSEASRFFGPEFMAAYEADIVRNLFLKENDDPEAEVIPLGDGKFQVKQNVKVGRHTGDGVPKDSPYVLCMSREPTTKSEWESLRASLPDRYETWTITEDAASLQFEVECGIKRWFGLNDISQHGIRKARQWIAYSFDLVPPSGDVQQAMALDRWFRKSKKYQRQNEYRFLWEITSPQMTTFPEFIDIELTKTGLGLFKPWVPPST